MATHGVVAAYPTKTFILRYRKKLQNRVHNGVIYVNLNPSFRCARPPQILILVVPPFFLRFQVFPKHILNSSLNQAVRGTQVLDSAMIYKLDIHVT